MRQSRTKIRAFNSQKMRSSFSRTNGSASVARLLTPCKTGQNPQTPFVRSVTRETWKPPIRSKPPSSKTTRREKLTSENNTAKTVLVKSIRSPASVWNAQRSTASGKGLLTKMAGHTDYLTPIRTFETSSQNSCLDVQNWAQISSWTAISKNHPILELESRDRILPWTTVIQCAHVVKVLARLLTWSWMIKNNSCAAKTASRWSARGLFLARGAWATKILVRLQKVRQGRKLSF